MSEPTLKRERERESREISASSPRLETLIEMERKEGVERTYLKREREMKRQERERESREISANSPRLENLIDMERKEGVQ